MRNTIIEYKKSTMKASTHTIKEKKGEKKKEMKTQMIIYF